MIKVFCNWYFLAVLVFGGFLLACSGLRVETDKSDLLLSNMPIGSTEERTSKNTFVRFFAVADLQAETDAQVQKILYVLEDALNLPLEELRSKRYPDHGEVPDQWTFGGLIKAHFLSVSAARGDDYVDTEWDEFLVDAKKSEAVPVLKRLITRVEEMQSSFENAIQIYEERITK